MDWPAGASAVFAHDGACDGEADFGLGDELCQPNDVLRRYLGRHDD